MKVFISWSGERSCAIAAALHEWLPSVIQTVKTWVSTQDINKGARWASELARELQDTQVGIICLTPENLNSPWLIFEAGALSRSQQNTYACTFLYALDSTDLKGPMAQFQATTASKEDVRKLVLDINKLQNDSAIPERQVNTAFERGWPDFERALKNVPESQTGRRVMRSERDILEEILGTVRSLAAPASSWESKHKSRLVTTLGWSHADAQLLFDYYQRLLNELETMRDDHSMAERKAILENRIHKMETNEEFALGILESIRKFNERNAKSDLKRSAEEQRDEDTAS